MADLCDLHMHSGCSDGVDQPEDLVYMAKENGIAAIALTDHNTTKGLKRFKEAALANNIQFSCGSELTTEYNGCELHIIGHFLPEDRWDEIEKYLEVQVARKDKANRETIDALKAAGYPVSYEEFDKFPHDGTRNRKQIAKYLVSKEIVENEDAAWQKFFYNGSPFKIESIKFDSLDAIKALRSFGAVPVLAHPLRSKFDETENMTKEQLQEFMPKAVDAGLLGIEVIHSNISPEGTEFLKDLANKYGLLMSGGSDYHGFSINGKKANLEIGQGYSIPEVDRDKYAIEIPYEFFEKLREKSKTL